MNKECFAQEVLARKEKLYRIAYCYVKNEQDSLDLFRAMDSLTEKDRACVVLRYFEEKSYRQHRTMGAAGFGRSFTPIVQYEKWEIHKVFPHFSYFRLGQNLLPNLLAPLCGVAIE